MPIRTLLSMTQDILTSMGSDDVNSISDTVEATDVARIIRQTYYDLLPNIEMKRHEDLFKLDASGDSAKPTLMTLPSNVVRLDWVQYDHKKAGETNEQYKYITWVPLPRFLEIVNGYDTDETNVSSMSIALQNGTFTFKYKNDAHPTIYTSPDDEKVIFDSYLSTLDTTLQATKTYCYGLIDETFTLSDNFQMDIDPEMYSLFFNSAKSQCFAEIKMTPNPIAVARARRAMIRSQRSPGTAPRLSGLNRGPDYGRK